MNTTPTADDLADAPLGSIVWSESGDTPLVCKLDRDEQPWHAADSAAGGATYFGNAKLADYLEAHYPNARLEIPALAAIVESTTPIDHLIAFAATFTVDDLQAKLDGLTMAQVRVLAHAARHVAEVQRALIREVGNARDGHAIGSGS